MCTDKNSFLIKVCSHAGGHIPPAAGLWAASGSSSGDRLWCDLNYKKLKIEILKLLDMMESNLWFVKRDDLPPAEFLYDQQFIGTWRLLVKNNSLNQTI